MANEFESAEYKRGFIIGMLMNPLFVTTETAADTPSTESSSGVVSVAETGIYSGVISNVVKVTDIS